jgi:hypothetical protein
MFRPSWYLTQTLTQRKKRRVSGQDRYHNDVYVVTTVQLSGCLVEPRLTFGTENTAGQEHVGGGLDLFCSDVDADIAATDEFVIDGLAWQVDGPTNRYRYSRLGLDFCHVTLERITG